MSNIEHLLNKYYKQIVQNATAIETPTHAEKHTSNYNTRLKREQYNRHRHLILDELLTEIPYHYTDNEISTIRYWIDRFNDNFKDFHRTSSNETIILAFLMIYWKQKNPKIKVSELPISQKYDLTENRFTLIQNRLIFQLMRTTELTYSQAKYVNHDYL